MSQTNSITIVNADLSSKSNLMINSPRTIEACNNLGVQVEELYKPTFEEFKSNNPELIHLSPEILKYHYEGREKIRLETIKKVKKERERIIKEEEKSIKSKNRYYKTKSVEKLDMELKVLKAIEQGKKTIEQLKKQQRLNIEAYIEDQINQDIMIKTKIAQENKMKAIELENMKLVEIKKSEQ